MKESNLKILIEWIAGICVGTLVGVFGFVNLLNYGGNNGCWTWVNKVFHGVGYESCGPFGGVVGILLGAIIGVIVMKKIHIFHYGKISFFLTVATFLLPFLYGVLVFQGTDLLIAPAFTLFFVALSFIPSIIITLAVNRLLFRKRHELR